MYACMKEGVVTLLIELPNKKGRFCKHYLNVHVLTVTNSPNVLPYAFYLSSMTSRKIPSTLDPLRIGHEGCVQGVSPRHSYYSKPCFQNIYLTLININNNYF